ncbi:MAG: hypothetical protein ISS56_03995 [Anaerolineae bacterium]|nr:hypothetical protein [Anaerolineae bacterium]
MSKRVWWIVVLSLAVLSLIGCCCCSLSRRVSPQMLQQRVNTGSVRRDERRINLEGAEGVDVTVQFGGGELTIESGSDGLLDGEFTYNLADLEPEIAYDVADGRGKLRIQHKEDVIRWDRATTEVRNEWVLRLTDRVPLTLDVDVGASRGELDLGGLRLTDLNLVSGAAELRVRFDQPNPERLASMHIRSGAAKLELRDLGNANLEELTFDGGLGAYILDFGGEWRHSARVEIQAGASRISLRVPSHIGVRVCAGDLQDGDYDGLAEQEGCYVNPLYGESDITLDIDLDLGLGKLDVVQTD